VYLVEQGLKHVVGVALGGAAASVVLAVIGKLPWAVTVAAGALLLVGALAGRSAARGSGPAVTAVPGPPEHAAAFRAAGANRAGAHGLPAQPAGGVHGGGPDASGPPAWLVAEVAQAASAVQQTIGTVDDGHRSLSTLKGSLDQLGSDARAASGDVDASRNLTFQILGQMQALGESSEQISAVVETIRKIASQTNLLALNAKIEAARAGESGRGFAVVAAEVHGLAQGSRKATEAIDAIVAEMREMTDATIEVAELASNQVESASTSMQTVLADIAPVQGVEAETDRAVREASSQLNHLGAALTRLAHDVSALKETSHVRT
jgi:chromosome segregation ATPase